MIRITPCRTRIAAVFAAVVLAGAAAMTPAAGTGPVRAAGAPPPPPAPQQLMYAGGGHLWLVPVDGGAPRLIHTPWALPKGPNAQVNVQWSPDGGFVAIDDGKSRLAVINLATGRQTVLPVRSCTFNCGPPLFTWSPNSRYLGILRPYGDGTSADLLVWDRVAGSMRTLATNASGYVSTVDWSHDGARMLVSIGKFDTLHNTLPTATIFTVSGQKRALSKGIGYGWSPDDKFVGILRSHECGANTCDDAEKVQSSTGGAAITLTQHIQSTFEYSGWADGLLSGGPRYAFDRWLLGPAGHVFRRLAAANERIDAWAPDGSRVAVQTYHPYEETPDALFLSTAQGTRVHLYTAGRKDSCGACSKGAYQVTFNQCNSGLVAFATPTYPTPVKLVPVYPKLFLAHFDGSAETRIQVPGDDASPVTFADHDTALIIESGGKVFRYGVANKVLTQIASSVTAVASPPLSQVACA